MVIAAVTMPALGQEVGGRTLTFGLRQGGAVERNPDQNPDGNEVVTTATTDLSFGLATRTRRAALEVMLDARLRALAGDTKGDSPTVDRSGLGLSYSYVAPGSRIEVGATVRQQDIDYLRAVDLVELVDGTLVVPEDLGDLQGTGTRLSSTFRMAASFGDDRPFGWGIALSGTDLDYRDVSSAGLVDSQVRNVALTGRFDINPLLRLNTRLGHATRDTEATKETATTSLDLGLTLARPADGALRARVAFAFPEDGADRMTLTGGMTRALSPQSRVGFDLGMTAMSKGKAQAVGRLGVDMALTPTLDVNADASLQVGESTTGATTLTSGAQIGLDFGLSRQSSLSFDTAYAEQKILGGGSDVSEVTLSAQLDRKLNKDWTMSVGAVHTRRDTSTTDVASSDRVFLTIGRDWTGKF